jgi:hypothetical protein
MGFDDSLYICYTLFREVKMRRYILISMMVISLAVIGLPLFSSIALPEDEDIQEVEEIKVVPGEEASISAPVKTKQKKEDNYSYIKLILSDAVPFLSEELLLSEEETLSLSRAPSINKKDAALH